MTPPAGDETAEGQGPLAAYDYLLPPELVAQRPAGRRCQSRLLVLPRESGREGGGPEHRKVALLTRILRPGDLLVMNDTRVVAARLMGRKATGGMVEMLLLSPANPLASLPGGGERHEVLLRTHRALEPGAGFSLEADPETLVRVVERGAKGRSVVDLPRPALELARLGGAVPLPPYIRRPRGPEGDDAVRYQTVYAAREGAVAAPTAGLHFSRPLLAALERRGVALTRLTLHVGYGTFAEPSPGDLARGRLHAEWVDVGEETCRAVEECRSRGGRVVAVGTTSTRALEWAAREDGLKPARGWCDILIAPGHRWRVVDGLLTNFHLPRTTLLMLVSALAGRERVLAAYGEAVAHGYRFYSYGDAMLII